MRRLALLCLLASTGCLMGTRTRERDDRLTYEILRQQNWAEKAVAGRATPDELSRIRQSDYEAVASGRKRLRALLLGIDRGTWVRDAVAQAVRDGDDDPQLLRAFDRAGELRRDAANGAEELADALSDARGGLSMGDLKPGLEAFRKARESDAHLPKDPAHPLQASPLSGRRGLLAAFAKIVQAHPEQRGEIDRLPPEEATQVRAELEHLGSRPQAEQPSQAQGPRPRAEQPSQPQGPQAAPAPQQPGSPQQPAAPQPPAGPQRPEDPQPPSADGPAQQAEVPPDTLTIAGDARDVILKRGPPKAFVTRIDGLFGLRYDNVELVFDASGKKVREEPVEGPR